MRKPTETLFEADIEISDDVFILKEEDARKLREPPTLKELRLNRTSVTLKIGDQATFKCEGFDQYGQKIDTGTITWTATGGMITADGLLTIGDNTGEFEVTAKVGEIETAAELRVQKDGPPPPPMLPGKKTIRWSAPQKWVNFYTKVLSKLASNPELKLRVSFEVPAEPDHLDSKADETRSGLLDLGLEGDVQVQ